MNREDMQRAARARKRAAEGWKKFGLAWLFWGVAGFSVNAVPWWTREQLEWIADLAAIVSFLPNLVYLVSYHEPEDPIGGPLGEYGLVDGSPLLAFVVFAAGFAAGHFCVRDPSILHSELTNAMFLVHGGVVAAFAACKLLSRNDVDYVGRARVLQTIGRVTGGLSMAFFLLNVLRRL